MGGGIEMTKAKIADLLKKKNFMIRMDDGEGRGHHGFQWGGIGVWTKCPDWSVKSYKRPRCHNGGLFGQSPAGAGYSHSGKRLVLCETKGKHYRVSGNKVKVCAAMHLAYDEDIPGVLLNAIPDLSLKLSGTKLKTLPKGLKKIGGLLDLSGSVVTSLPKNLCVGIFFDVRSNKRLVLPEGLRVGGNFYAMGAKNIKTLPKNMRVGGSLYIDYSSVKFLPKGLHVGGALDIRATAIRSLPKDLQVGGYIVVSPDQLTGKIPAHLQGKIRP